MDQITILSVTLNWQDIIDILLNSYILFRIYVIFRGTNAFRVLIGISILWFFQIIATEIGLILTRWALQGITALGALIIIIVFRNEIPKVFYGKNIMTILWGFQQKTFRTPIEIIVESVFDMSKRSCGALIVFPGKEDLNDVVQGSISWDGIISKEMITSIFWHDNPVHDGAIIIKQDKIIEVGAILPLSRRNDLPTHYGTRHRAAVGLTEVKDAMVITVSEERGEITVTKDDKIINIQEKKTLEKVLMEHLGMPKDGENKESGSIKENFRIILAGFCSLIIISAIWFNYTKGSDTLITLEVPVEYINRDPIMDIVDLSVDNKVHLHLNGPEGIIKSIKPDHVRVRIDVNEAILGKNTFYIKKSDITLPPGVKLTRVEPPEVDVTLDFQTTKDVYVQADWAGSLDKNLLLKSVIVIPDKIKLSGSSLILEKISTIYTMPVLLNTIKNSGVLETKLNIDNKSIKIDPEYNDFVMLKYEIVQNPDKNNNDINKF